MFWKNPIAANKEDGLEEGMTVPVIWCLNEDTGTGKATKIELKGRQGELNCMSDKQEVKDDFQDFGLGHHV